MRNSGRGTITAVARPSPPSPQVAVSGIAAIATSTATTTAVEVVEELSAVGVAVQALPSTASDCHHGREQKPLQSQSDLATRQLWLPSGNSIVIQTDGEQY